MSEEKTLYFEQYKILNAEDGIEEGMKRVEIEVKEGESVKFDIPEWELTAVMTEEPIDATEGRNKRAIVVVDEIYDILKKRNVKVEEVGFYMQKLMSKMQGEEDEAINNCFGVSHKQDIRISNWESKK